MTEEWRDIPGYEGRYQVSDLGRVKRLSFLNVWGYLWPEIILKQCEWYGYKVVWLSYRNIRKKYKVHRLVAMAFLTNTNSKEFVNHIDRDRRNNTLSNLEWVTPQENTDHWMAF